MSVSIAVVWLIPGVNPAAEATPLWAVLPSLVLAISGTALFKSWELRVENATSFTDIPAGLLPVPDSMHKRTNDQSRRSPTCCIRDAVDDAHNNRDAATVMQDRGTINSEYCTDTGMHQREAAGESGLTAALLEVHTSTGAGS
jgi:hypothetical protein